MAEVLGDLPKSADPNLLVGFNHADDGGVYKISETQALVQTLDFFTPIVDDPYWFGKIAAANALSDVYAMGGKPLTALGIVCFPEATMPISILKEILRGGADIVAQAGAVIVGGHSVKDSELKYGLSITGMVHPDKFTSNEKAKVGDTLFLSKPLGTGIVCTAIKRDKASAEVTQRVMEQMATLNREAAEVALSAGVQCMTDVTGFGLLGHALEIAKASNVTLEFNVKNIPIIPEALEYAKAGLVTGGGKSNKEFIGDALSVTGEIDENLMHILFDPQTSGGLLICAPEGTESMFVDAGYARVGNVSERKSTQITLQ
ncbi:selenide, water dikinase SelD [Gemmatimonas aurantiaca]|nr:selenide, water dikinase SelD [Gemmatimonas aurantiaca]